MSIKKTKYTLFHKSCSKDDIPLKLPDLKYENLNIKTNSSIKFLGVMLNDHISLRDHIGTVESKMAKILVYYIELDKYELRRP